jgi:hypothetical protein
MNREGVADASELKERLKEQKDSINFDVQTSRVDSVAKSKEGGPKPPIRRRQDGSPIRVCAVFMVCIDNMLNSLYRLLKVS